jgi:hypothetical protein
MDADTRTRADYAGDDAGDADDTTRHNTFTAGKHWVRSVDNWNSVEQAWGGYRGHSSN